MSDDEGTARDRVIDLSSRKDEGEWAYSAQGFYESATALWFKWLGWIFAIGGVAFLAEKTGSMPLLVIEKISYFLLTWYFLYFFSSIRVEPYYSWARNQTSRLKRFLALLPMFCLAASLTFGAHLLIEHLIILIKIGK